MREIIFRGKRIDNGEWVEGYLCKSVMYLETSHQNVVVDTIEVYDGKSYLNIVFRNVFAISVGQFTGLKDKNGKKIFEGDIVRDAQSCLFGKVIYATPQDGFDGIAGFMVDDVDDGLQNYNGFWNQLEVIGNIHDNPELLGVTDNA